MTERPRAKLALLFFLGAWITMSVGMAYLASGNFRVLDTENLRHADEVYAGIPVANQERWMAVRYAASELNRYYFTLYSRMQMVWAAVALGLTLLAGLKSRVVTSCLTLAFVISIVLLFGLLDPIIELGREIDFVPREPETEERARFQTLHAWNVGLELLKLAALAVATGALLRRE